MVRPSPTALFHLGCLVFVGSVMVGVAHAPLQDAASTTADSRQALAASVAVGALAAFVAALLVRDVLAGNVLRRGRVSAMEVQASRGELVVVGRVELREHEGLEVWGRYVRGVEQQVRMSLLLLAGADPNGALRPVAARPYRISSGPAWWERNYIEGGHPVIRLTSGQVLVPAGGGEYQLALRLEENQKGPAVLELSWCRAPLVVPVRVNRVLFDRARGA